MKLAVQSLAGALFLSGCASVAVHGPVRALNPVPAAVAGRPIVYRTGCPERLKVDTLAMTDFAEEFPGQRPDDSEFQVFVEKPFSERIASGARRGRFSLEQVACDSSAKPAKVGFSQDGAKLLLDTAGLDTNKVYVARSPIRFVLADSSFRNGFFGRDVPNGIKLIDVEMSYGLFDPRDRRLIATGLLRGLSSTGSISKPDVVRDDWYSASKRLAEEFENRLDSLLAPDTAAVRR
jgi:hypothetical protein